MRNFTLNDHFGDEIRILEYDDGDVMITFEESTGRGEKRIAEMMLNSSQAQELKVIMEMIVDG